MLRRALAALLAIAGAGFVIDASYPGYLNPDSVGQLEQAVTGRYDDWHSPFMALLWRGLLALAPGPVGPLLLEGALIWGSLTALAIGAQRRLGVAALLLLGVPLLPGSFNYLGNIHVDTLLAGWLLASLPCILAADRDGAGRAGAVLAARIAANALLLCGFLTRPNAILALVPLLLLANRRLGGRRMALATGTMLLAMPLLLALQDRVLHATPLHLADAVKTYDLLALSDHERQNLFPGRWTAVQAHDITSACYTPIQWDPAWGGHCRFIFDTLHRQRLWGSPSLTAAWARAMLHHPLGAVTMMLPTFRLALFDPNSPSMFYPADNRWGWRVADDPPRAASALSRRYVDWPVARFLGRPACFALLSVASLLLLLRSGAATTGEGRLALAVLCSGLAYLLSYFPIIVSAEYRYFYWCAFAAYVGTVLAALAIRRHRLLRLPARQAAARLGPAGEAGVALAAASLALLAACAVSTLPETRRIVAVSPQGGPLRVAAIRDANVLFWRRRDFPGQMEDTGWHRDAGGYVADGGGAPLIAAIDGRNQDLEVLLAAPAPGRALVSSDGFSRLVEAPPGGGELSVIIRARPAAPPAIGLPLGCTAGLAASFLVSLALLRRWTGPRSRIRRAA